MPTPDSDTSVPREDFNFGLVLSVNLTGQKILIFFDWYNIGKVAISVVQFSQKLNGLFFLLIFTRSAWAESKCSFLNIFLLFSFATVWPNKFFCSEILTFIWFFTNAILNRFRKCDENTCHLISLDPRRLCFIPLSRLFTKTFHTHPNTCV